MHDTFALEFELDEWIDGGKTQVRNGENPEAKNWKGSEVPSNQLEKTFQKQETLIRRTPLVPDWANYLFQSV